MDELKHRTPEEISQIYDMVSDEIDKMLSIINEKTGYYASCQYSLFSDEPKQCMDVDMKISLLENPHGVNIDKAKYYAKVNPDNCLNRTISAYKHNSWYMIYDGVHRTSANKLLGNEIVKVDIIVPNPKYLNL